VNGSSTNAARCSRRPKVAAGTSTSRRGMGRRGRRGASSGRLGMGRRGRRPPRDGPPRNGPPGPPGSVIGPPRNGPPPLYARNPPGWAPCDVERRPFRASPRVGPFPGIRPRVPERRCGPGRHWLRVARARRWPGRAADRERGDAGASGLGSGVLGRRRLVADGRRRLVADGRHPVTQLAGHRLARGRPRSSRPREWHGETGRPVVVRITGEARDGIGKRPAAGTG
jgi:hypothetical protein